MWVLPAAAERHPQAPPLPGAALCLRHGWRSALLPTAAHPQAGSPPRPLPPSVPPAAPASSLLGAREPARPSASAQHSSCLFASWPVCPGCPTQALLSPLEKAPHPAAQRPGIQPLPQPSHPAETWKETSPGRPAAPLSRPRTRPRTPPHAQPPPGAHTVGRCAPSAGSWGAPPPGSRPAEAAGLTGAPSPSAARPGPMGSPSPRRLTRKKKQELTSQNWRPPCP